jgi:hypothetical protein
MKRYLLSIYQPDGDPPPPEFLAPIMKNVAALIEELKAAGALVLNGGLKPARAATVARLRDGRVITTDGPFTESKEHLGGLVVIRAPDLEAALEWGRKTARATTLPIEVREFQDGEH